MYIEIDKKSSGGNEKKNNKFFILILKTLHRSSSILHKVNQQLIQINRVVHQVWIYQLKNISKIRSVHLLQPDEAKSVNKQKVKVETLRTFQLKESCLHMTCTPRRELIHILIYKSVSGRYIQIILQNRLNECLGRFQEVLLLYPWFKQFGFRV